MYIVLWCHEDGLHIEEFTKEELLAAMSEKDEDYQFSKLNLHEDLRNSYDLMQMCNQGIVIKGKIVTPFPKKVVTEFDIE